MWTAVAGCSQPSRASFGDPGNAAAFLCRVIPPAVAEKIQWEQLRLQPGSFIDSHYRQSESDLLFSAPFAGKQCFVYLLFEHQTTGDSKLALRLLRYMVRIWESWVKRHPEPSKMPVILPVVLAQNAEAWHLSPQFSALLDLPSGLQDELRPFVPDFTFRLIQLASLPFDSIRGTLAGIMTLRVMKAERLDDLLNHFVWDEPLLLQLPQEVRERLLLYIIDGRIDIEAFHRKVQLIANPELQTTAMSLAEQLHQKGLEKGLRQTLIKILQRRFGQIPEGLVEAIDGIHETAGMESLVDAALDAASMEEFARAL